MKYPIRIFALLLVLGVFSCQSVSDSTMENGAEPSSTAQQHRIISLSGMLTEVLFELGYGDQIVGLDITSTYPEATNAVPKLGHVSKLNAEAILQMQPDVIFVEGAVAAQPALQQLEAAGIDIVVVPTAHHLFNAVRAAEVMANYLGANTEVTDRLQDQIQQDSLALATTLSQYQVKPTVLFIYARGIGRLSVAGTGTSAAVIIEKAGGQNAISSFEGFQVLTPEALVESAPDVILMFSSGLASLDGVEGLEQIPGMDQTPAYRNKRVVAMDGHYLTAFGPRAAQAAKALAQAIHENTAS